MNRSRILVTASGVLVWVAVIGAFAFDWLWWSLIPAAALLSVGLLREVPEHAPSVLRFARPGLGVAALLALLVSILGMVMARTLGVEPTWIGSASTVAGLAVVGTASILGMTIMAQGRGSRMTGLLLVSALPVGLGVDWGLDSLLPPGLPNVFLLGAGFYLGLGLFGLALIRLGRLLPGATDGSSPTT